MKRDFFEVQKKVVAVEMSGWVYTPFGSLLIILTCSVSSNLRKIYLPKGLTSSRRQVVGSERYTITSTFLIRRSMYIWSSDHPLWTKSWSRDMYGVSKVSQTTELIARMLFQSSACLGASILPAILRPKFCDQEWLIDQEWGHWRWQVRLPRNIEGWRSIDGPRPHLRKRPLERVCQIWIQRLG